MTTTTITVSTAAELMAALAASTGGETILLEGGNYGDFTLSAKSKFDLDLEGVTIKSADPDNPAVFTTMALHGVSNLTIDGVIFDYTFSAGDVSYTKPFLVSDSTNITITNSVFDGDVASGVSEVDDGYGYAYGLVVRNSTGVTISDNDFHTWLRGAVFSGSTGLTITGNEVHDIRSDGMDFVAVQDVLIEDNYFHDFRASYDSSDHRDMIQFWTNGSSRPSTDITINSNIFDIGEGSSTQSIFMRNEEVDTGRAGTEMYYQNITITNNTIYNGHLHGITVGETDGLVIANNSVIAVTDQNNPNVSSSAVWIPTIRVASASINVEITENAVAKITGYTDQSSWAVVGNVLIQNTDPHASGYYGDVFITSSMDASSGVHTYIALPGGILDTSGAGSSETAAITELAAYALYSASVTSGGTVTFDASLTQSLLGTAGVGATYVWTFGDGTTAEGVTVSHVYNTGSSYDVTLTVTTASDRVLTAGNIVEVVGSQVLSYDPETQSFIVHHAGISTSLGQLTSLDGDEIQLGGTGTAASVSRSNLSALRGSDDFSIDFSLQADTIGSSGELFRLHVSFIASVNKAGDLVFQIFDAAGGSKTLTSTGAGLNDGAEHDVSVQLNNGSLHIYVDGEDVGSMAFTGSLPTSGSWDLTFGNPWGKANFEGDLSAFAINVDTGSYGQSETLSSLSTESSLTTEAAQTTETSQTVEDSVTTDTSHSTDDASLATTLATSAARLSSVTTLALHDDASSTDATATTAQSSEDDNPLSGGLVLNIASLAKSSALVGATVSTSEQGSVLSFDGDKDYVKLAGASDTYKSSEQIAFSVDFNRSGDMEGQERLVWNHLKLGLTLEDDGLVINVATADQGFKSYKVADLGLDDTDAHNVTLMLDTASDRLQVLVDGQIALDVSDADYDIVGAGGREWGWSLGTAWNRYFEGEVSAFQLTDDFHFLDHNSADGATLIA